MALCWTAVANGGTKSVKPSLYFILEMAIGIFPQTHPLLSGTVLADEGKSSVTQTVSSLDNHRPQLQPEPVPLFTSTDIA